VSGYQKGKTRKGQTNLDLLEQEIVSGSGICWAMQVCTSSQTTMPTSHHTLNKILSIKSYMIDSCIEPLKDVNEFYMIFNYLIIHFIFTSFSLENDASSIA